LQEQRQAWPTCGLMQLALQYKGGIIMAVKQISVTTGGNVKKYQALTTDAVETYPTIADCGLGSTMRIIDPTIHEVVGYKEFDGTNWNKL
jgi:hypothetical protein